MNKTEFSQALRRALGKDVYKRQLQWCSDENRYYADGEVDAQLRGRFEMVLKNGDTVACRTALEVLAERMKPYTISRATEVTGVPENKIVDAVHTYATKMCIRDSCVVWKFFDMSGYM